MATKPKSLVRTWPGKEISCRKAEGAGIGRFGKADEVVHVRTGVQGREEEDGPSDELVERDAARRHVSHEALPQEVEAWKEI